MNIWSADKRMSDFRLLHCWKLEPIEFGVKKEKIMNTVLYSSNGLSSQQNVFSFTIFPQKKNQRTGTFLYSIYNILDGLYLF